MYSCSINIFERQKKPFYYLVSNFFHHVIGYEVTAYVRDKQKLGSIEPNYVVEGDVLNKSDVSDAVKGHDAIIIVLGTRNDLSKCL